MPRPHIEHVCASDLAEADFAYPWWPVGAMLTTLSADSTTGALTGVLRLPPGYRRPAGYLEHASEFFVLDGTLRVGGRVRGFGYYEYAPGGAGHAPWTVDEGCSLLFMARGGQPQFAPGPAPRGDDGRVEVASDALEWIAGVSPLQPVGSTIKILRKSATTGESVLLVAMVPDYDLQVLEYHDFVQESYLVVGDGSRGGTDFMAPGSYSWRNAWVTHGRFRTERGAMLFLWNEKEINHWYVDDALRTPDENRREALVKPSVEQLKSG